MADSEKRGNDSGRAVEADIARYKDQASVELSAAQASEAQTGHSARRRLGGHRINHADRARLISQARDIRFPIAMRGYERTAVDRYVKDVNRLIAELEMTASPESAVRRALEEVSEETRDLLQRAHQTAEDITARSRVKADDRLGQAEAEARSLRDSAQRDADSTRDAAQDEADAVREAAQNDAHELRSVAQRESAALRDRATREAADLREKSAREATEVRDTAAQEAKQMRVAAKQEANRLLSDARREVDELLDAAETRTRELSQNAETIWRERRRLVEDMRAIGEQLSAIGDAEAKRFPRLPETLPPVTASSQSHTDTVGDGGPDELAGGQRRAPSVAGAQPEA